MIFSLSIHNVPNKIFLVNRSELAGRIDPEMVLYNRKTKSFKFNSIALKNLLKKAPQYGANESGIERKSLSEARYIRITDIDEYGLLKDSIGVTAETIEEKYILNNNDILLARSGATVGKAYLHNKNNVTYDCFFAGYMIRIVVDETLILPSYFFTYSQLSPYQNWVKSIQRAAGQPNINAEEYKSLMIPIPPIKIQQKIVDLIESSYAAKKIKETQAFKLMASIDTYLLNELGIHLHEKDNSLESRIFTTLFSKVTGERLDPIFYASDLSKFNSGSYQSIELKEIAIKFKSGIGAGKQDQAIDGNGIIQIRPTNIDENGLLKFDRNVYIPYDSEFDCLDVDDVLFNNTNSQELVGKTAILKEQIELCYSNHITKIKVAKEKINPDYLWIMLNLYQRHKVFYSICTNWNNQSGIGLDLLKSLKIPLPPIEKQNEIAKHIQDIHLQAKSQKEDAISILDSAKQEVEKMILG